MVRAELKLVNQNFKGCYPENEHLAWWTKHAALQCGT